MSRQLGDRVSFAVLPDGTRAVIVETDIPDDAPPPVREGLARRALVNRGGTCPCGARVVLPNREQRRQARRARNLATVKVAEHEHDCPAGNEVLLAQVRAWQAAAS